MLLEKRSRNRHRVDSESIVKIQRVEPNTERSVETQLATLGRVSA